MALFMCSALLATSEISGPSTCQATSKGEQLLQDLPYYFRYKSRNIPHIDKRDKGGEDGWTESPSFLAIADGYGGWAWQGVDPGLFSKQLCKDL